ncbi:MAG: septal ring lytic transglycosylase RlpA family protein [Holosporales bacterium]|jgi:rare lipoprotein A|nr:septal ring lytic transglycosylase RlpA family protein [Holosporales bacterium]
MNWKRKSSIKKYFFVALVVAMSVLSTVVLAKIGPRFQEITSTATQGPLLSQRLQIGIASWYGGRDRGKPTASGIIFNPDACVAAHSTLPLPTVVRVTNLSNGRSAEVFVIDRLPKKWGRAIDLSEGVAEKLGFVRKGLTPVRIDIVARPSMKFVRAALKETTEASKEQSEDSQRGNTLKNSAHPAATGTPLKI